MMASSEKVVALGGGHGLAATLQALRHVSRNLTAVVTVADDGGSSGRLRGELGCLPPGDLRMALSALCDDTEWGHTWSDILQHRFHTDGPLNHHAVGNLLIASIWEQLGDPVAGLDLVGRLLGARGRVLPMAMVPLEIDAHVRIGDEVVTVRGQSRVAVTRGEVLDIWLEPADPPACPEAVAAIFDADVVVLGPGSWYTSVLPHLLVPGLRDAIFAARRRVLTANLATERGETENMTPGDHLRVLQRFAPNLTFDTVIADPFSIDDLDDFTEAASALGATVLLRQVRSARAPGSHDPLRLAAAYRDAFENWHGDVGEGKGS